MILQKKLNEILNQNMNLQQKMKKDEKQLELTERNPPVMKRVGGGYIPPPSPLQNV